MKFDKCQTKSLNERKYKEKIDVYAYSNELLIEFTNCIFSNIDLINKFENVDIDRNSTRSLEYTFGRARIRVHDVHTLQKFIKAIGEMNETIITNTNEEIEKIKGRTASFEVTVEDTEEPEEQLFEPQQIAIQFLNFINIDNSNEGNDDDFDSLFQFIDYLAEFDNEIKTKALTTKTIAMGIQETKTIKQRISFKISDSNNKFIDFFNQHFPDQKILKSFLMNFYKIVKKNVKDFPVIQKKIQKKKHY
ncbi:hypothetical protein M9Y10_028490 [Tritrichomonas musculus]|uniref:Uncharacterized protein n=1 Tax=Tritrichomonas musculus TaxID=1915356 RepID=A0ABR2KK79_9EUKA